MYINGSNGILRINRTYCISTNPSDGVSSCFAFIGDIEALLESGFVSSTSADADVCTAPSVCGARTIGHRTSVIAIRVFYDEKTYFVQRSKRNSFSREMVESINAYFKDDLGHINNSSCRVCSLSISSTHSSHCYHKADKKSCKTKHNWEILDRSPSSW